MTYTVIDSRDKRNKLDLLQNVSGHLRPGEMSALMGPSGSGKTTLLDLLAGRKTVGQCTGEIAFGGHRPTSMFLRRFTGYVEQFDTLVPVLTVREMLMYTAELKRPRSEPVEAKAEAVEELLRVLALHTCAGVQIGSSMARGISGGQAKRVNIGIALVANPRVLFLDEPTSGLDSYTASEVMSVVKSLSRQGITVCATIHSPTPYCFSLFDRLLLLLGGKAAYSGPNGKAAIDYFRNSAVCKGVAALAPGQNEAEWIVDLTVKADRQGRAGELAEAFASSDRCAEEREELESALGNSEALDAQVASELAVRRSTVTPFWHALWVLLKYRTSRNYRDPGYIMPRLADKVLFSFIIATLYLHVGKDLSSTNVVNLSSLVFISVVLPAYSASAYVPSLVLDRPLFLRERADGLYRVITYLVHRIVEEAALAIPLSVGVAALIFYPVELQGSFLAFWLVYLVTLLIGIMLGYMIASISKVSFSSEVGRPGWKSVCPRRGGGLTTRRAFFASVSPRNANLTPDRPKPDL